MTACCWSYGVSVELIRSQIGNFGMKRWHARNSYWSEASIWRTLAAPELLSYRLGQAVYRVFVPFRG